MTTPEVTTTEHVDLHKWFLDFDDDGQVLTAFGTARLVRYLDGALELQGGSPDDRQAAYEWLSLFWHEAVVREVAA